MSPLETRQSLIVRLKSEQNELAWRDFVCAYEGFLNQLVRRQGVPERHVPDITQQILLTIARSCIQTSCQSCMWIPAGSCRIW